MILSEAISRFDTDVLAHLDRDATIPHITAAGIQGDVSFLLDTALAVATTPVLAAGVAVVHGENGGNSHTLHAEGTVMYDLVDGDPKVTHIGTMTVTDGSTAFLIHPEHGAMSFGPGTWRVGRQREQAEVTRFVAD